MHGFWKYEIKQYLYGLRKICNYTLNKTISFSSVIIISLSRVYCFLLKPNETLATLNYMSENRIRFKLNCSEFKLEQSSVTMAIWHGHATCLFLCPCYMYIQHLLY
jgi:hypothetical protein